MATETAVMPNDERDDESGRFASKYTDGDFLDAIATLGGAASTTEITDAVGCPKRTAQHRLGKLRDDGRVTVREVGGAFLWQLDESDEDAPRDDAPRRDDQPPAEPPERRGGDPAASQDKPAAGPSDAPDAAGSWDDVDDATVADLDDALAGVDFPPAQDREACLRAIGASLAYLRAEGPASMREIVMDVMESHPLKYDVPDLKPGQRYRGSWWRKVVKPALETLDAVEYRDGYNDYRFIEADEDGGERP